MMRTVHQHHAGCRAPVSFRSSYHGSVARTAQRPRSSTCTNASFLDSITTLFSGGKKAGSSAAVKARRPASVQRILDLVSVPDKESVDKAEMVRLVTELQQEQEGKVTTDAELLSATWKLLWTTEKETEFIVKNAGVFGTKSGDVYQVIDVDEGTLQNVITFPPEGAFVVNSSIAVEGDQRVAFRFITSELQLPKGRKIGLPPFGKGWFDNIYVDEEVRIARDIRDDVLVVTRDGPPRPF